MHKYSVEVQELVTYTVPVKASSDVEASNRAVDFITNSIERDSFFSSVDDLQTIDVTLIEE